MDRSVAYIVSLQDILAAQYVQTSEQMSPNYVVIRAVHVSRVNVIGVIISVSKDQERPITRITLEDGTGSMQLLDFEQRSSFLTLQPGDLVVVIGKVREYNNMRYILPEIIKTINHKWAAYRKKQLLQHHDSSPPARSPTPLPSPILPPAGQQKQSVHVTEESMDDEDDATFMQDVLSIVARLDAGDGADADAVIAAMKRGDAQEVLDAMLREGDIFQIRPGRYKIL